MAHLARCVLCGPNALRTANSASTPPQPTAWIHRFAVAAQFEIQGGAALATGTADGGVRVAGAYPVAAVLEQGVVVGVQAHPAVAVVDDQDQAAEIGRASCRERGCQYV